MRALVHITDIRVGDTVFHDNEIRTVCASDLKKDAAIGTTLFGDSYQLGYRHVIRIQPNQYREAMELLQELRDFAMSNKFVYPLGSLQKIHNILDKDRQQ